MEAIIRQLKIADITGDYNNILNETIGKLAQLYPVIEEGKTFYINAFGDIYFYFGDNGVAFCDRSFYTLFSFYNLDYNRHEQGKLNKHMIIIIKMILDMHFKSNLNVNILPLPI